jgi:hypothetical protein
VVAAVSTRVTQGTVISLDASTPDLRLTQATILAAYQHATTTLRISQAETAALVGSKPTLRTTQGTVMVLYLVGAENRKLRAWGFSQDGHDFYVLRGGTSWSFVYDLTTGQWSQWRSPSLNYLRAHLGLNWTGQAKTTLDRGFAWNVVGGDDTTGVLWLLDPTVNIDDNTDGTQSAFSRQVTGGIPQRLRNGVQCGAVYLTANLGSPLLTAPTVTLETSDDSGSNWVSHGALTVTSGDTTQELAWLGLGLMTAPGRLFRITDTGAITRISSLDMRGLDE